MIDGFIDDADRRIVVDDFDIARLRLSNLPHSQRPRFFLTHAHADHLRGLSADWDYAPIHCSPITRALVLGRFAAFRHAHLLQPIDGGDRIVLKLPPSSERSDENDDDIVTVTALPANHIAGSLMFLFQWLDARTAAPRSLLHSGDFRFASKMLNYDILRAVAIDRLVLDTTFLGAEWRHFPSRSDSIARVISIVDAHLAKHGSHARVYLGCDNIGFEPLFEALHQRFGRRICVPSILWRQLGDILEAQQHFALTSNEDDVEQHDDQNGWRYNDADGFRSDVYTRDPQSTTFFVVPFQLCADAARAARLDAHTLVGALPPIVRARGTQRRNRRRRLLREGRASSPTLIATDAIGRAAFVQAARERAPAHDDDADGTESIDDVADEWMPSTNVDRVIGVPTAAGVTESLRRMQKDVSSGAALLLQASTQFFRERHTRQSELYEGVWRVLYSNHSSRSEIEQFVRLVQPRTVQPFLRDVKPSDASWLQSLCHIENEEEDEEEEDDDDDEKKPEEDNDEDESSTHRSRSNNSAVSSLSENCSPSDSTESLVLLGTSRNVAKVPARVILPPTIVVNDVESSESASVTEIDPIAAQRFADDVRCGCKRSSTGTASQLSQQRRVKLAAALRWPPRSPLSELSSQGQQSSVSEIDEVGARTCRHQRQFVSHPRRQV